MDFHSSSKFNACLLLTILILHGLLFCWSSGAAVCNKNRGMNKGHAGSARRCKHFNLNDQSDNSWETSFSSKTYYLATPSPPMKTRELPKNPYAEYEDYYNSQMV